MTAVGEAYRAHRGLIFTLSYRILGVASEADEVVQETFVRALEHRPDASRPLRPWLVRVASNLARDRLRRRRRRPYAGPWLPSPLDDRALEAVEAVEHRADLGYAWMVALEALTPNQRAVLVLREALGLTVEETGEALALSTSNVKVTLHRARRALASATPPDPLPEAEETVARLLRALATGAVAEVLEALAPDAVSVSDGGGRYHAARHPVVGADRVRRLFEGLWRKNLPWLVGAERVRRAGHPAVLVTVAGAPEGIAPRSLTVFDVRGGRVARLWTVLSDDKLALDPAWSG